MWREANKERNAENKQRWASNNADRVREHKRRWNRANPEYFREYHEANRDRKIAATERWERENPERARQNSIASCQRRRARKMGATVESFTQADLHNYWLSQGVDPDSCFYCGGPHEHDDHVVPLSRGGTHERANLVPACELCNGSKGTRLIEEWLGAVT